ncbi:hypothetical protein NLG97_g4229 [Lecanicillium saksenae]|uniref:Uncharacterized protein n=1 Tax=Lecanicillium saksenae TaxID=468837 RepID=A0ACC1QXR3_9HYPO|nr:hypothetical protein NLG97_g4229 [Lecanicillium saksenae]
MAYVSPQELCNILVEFLRCFSYNDDARLPISDFHVIHAHVSTFFPQDQKIAESMCEYVHATFPFLPLEIRKAVAIYDTYQMAVDDVDVEEHDSLSGLCHQLAAGIKLQHNWWQDFFRWIPQLLQFYGNYSQATLFRGAIEFLQATAVERTLFRGYHGSKFPDYIRRMSAQGPVQAALCFPEDQFPQQKYLPVLASMEAELEDFVGTVNDLFSFYKEINNTAVDLINYPLNASACSGKKPVEVLREISGVALDCQFRLQAMLKRLGDQKVEQRMNDFLVGYVRYHLACDRYRILDLCIESGDCDLWSYYNMSRRAVGKLTSDSLPTGTKTRKLQLLRWTNNRENTAATWSRSVLVVFLAMVVLGIRRVPHDEITIAAT